MKERYIIIIIILVTVILLGVGVMLVSNNSTPASVAASENAKVILDAKEYDWGNISYDAANPIKTFLIKNTGSGVLKLTNIKTSCHCTRANVTINGKDSQHFGMSGISSWIGEVPAGKDAKLNVIFDQRFHGPSGVGPIVRYISVETNDMSNRKLVFTLKATVIK